MTGRDWRFGRTGISRRGASASAGGLVLAVLVFIPLATGSCGSKGGGAADAGFEGGTDGAAEAVGTTSCDPAAQNCSADQKCDFRCLGTSAVVDCQPSTGGAAVGSACSTNAMPCARGSGCVSMVGVGPLCRKYCAGDSDCAAGERCHNVTVGVTCTGGTTSFFLQFCY